MEELFELMISPGKKEGEETEARLGIRLKLSGYETACPITRSCSSYEALELEVEAIKKALERILNKANELFVRSEEQAGLGLEPDMGAEEIWSILSGIEDENVFMETFNGLDDAKRRQIAEYVLTRCNIFSGKASVFSARYDDQTALMA
jgi:hypothetical protein